MATPGRYNLRARKGAAGAGAAVVNTPPPAPGTEAHADTAVDRSGAAHAAPAPAGKGAGSAPNADGGDDSNTTKPVLLPAGDPAWSSGVPFYPPSERSVRMRTALPPPAHLARLCFGGKPHILRKKIR